MNGKQRVAIVLGFVVILLMGLYPPWLRFYCANLDRPPWRITTGIGPEVDRDGPTHCFYEHHAGYRFLFSDHREFAGSVGNAGGHQDDYIPRWVNYPLLLVQWFLVSAATGIIVMYLGDRSQSPTNKPAE